MTNEKAKQIYITENDRKRLLENLTRLASGPYKVGASRVEALQHELSRATVIDDPSQVPEDVITINSTVRIRNTATGNDMVLTLVMPSTSPQGEGKLSVLTTLGTALLGCRVGDTVEWESPRGLSRARVEELTYQPESVGHYHL